MTDYHTYIHSPAWRLRKIAFCAAAGWKCQACGADHWLGVGLQVHHKNYDRLYRERPQDVEVLCDRCHKREHGL